MRAEVIGSFHFKPQHFGWLEDVLLTASIALYEKSAGDRKRFKGIGFSERDLVAYHHVLALVDFYVSANHNPEVGSIRPRIGAHCDTPQVAESYAVGETGSRCLAFAWCAASAIGSFRRPSGVVRVCGRRQLTCQLSPAHQLTHGGGVPATGAVYAQAERRCKVLLTTARAANFLTGAGLGDTVAPHV